MRYHSGYFYSNRALPNIESFANIETYAKMTKVSEICFNNLV